MSLQSPRFIAGFIFLSCIALLVSAYYFEFVMELEPCPLCIMQRVGILLVGLAALAAWLHNAEGLMRRVYGFLIMLFAGLGAFFAGRHVWIQSLPEDQVPACGPSLEYMIDTMPLFKMIEVLMRGNGNCAEQSWVFLGLSMPAWVLVWFGLFFLLGAIIMLSRRNRIA